MVPWLILKLRMWAVTLPNFYTRLFLVNPFSRSYWVISPLSECRSCLVATAGGGMASSLIFYSIAIIAFFERKHVSLSLVYTKSFRTN